MARASFLKELLRKWILFCLTNFSGWISSEKMSIQNLIILFIHFFLFIIYDFNFEDEMGTLYCIELR